MAGRQAYETTKALRWIRLRRREGKGKTKCVKGAARLFGVHETTLWRALGKQKVNGK